MLWLPADEELREVLVNIKIDCTESGILRFSLSCIVSFCAKLRNRQTLYYYTGTLGNRSGWSVGGYENGFIRDAADDPAVSRIYLPLCLCAGRVPRSIVGVITIIMLKTTAQLRELNPGSVYISFCCNNKVLNEFYIEYVARRFYCMARKHNSELKAWSGKRAEFKICSLYLCNCYYYLFIYLFSGVTKESRCDLAMTATVIEFLSDYDIPAQL